MSRAAAFVRVLAAATLGLVLAGCGHDGGDAPAQVTLYSPDYPRLEIVLGPGQVTSPDGLLWRAGALYIADEGGSAVRVWRQGKVATLVGAAAGLKSPEDLRFSASGALFATDDSAGHVWRIDPAAGTARAVGGFAPPQEMEGIAEDPAGGGGMIVGDGHGGRLYRLSDAGEAAGLAAPQWHLAKPESMARAPDGALLVADNRADRLYRFDAAGVRGEVPLPADLSPESIAFAGADLWITDSHNGRLYRMRPGDEPRPVALFTGGWNNINGLAAAPDGTLYLSIQSDLAAKRGVVVALRPARGR